MNISQIGKFYQNLNVLQRKKKNLDEEKLFVVPKGAHHAGVDPALDASYKGSPLYAVSIWGATYPLAYGPRPN